MNDLLASLTLSSWKPLLTALLLPPVPLLAAMLLGAAVVRRRRVWGWGLLLAGAAGIWLASCSGVGRLIEQQALRPPPALTETQLAELARPVAGRRPVVLVLGGGRVGWASEYGQSHLSARSLQRLHYGVWLSRRLNAPLMISGGSGLGEADGTPEAEIAGRIAERDYGRAPRWLEVRSRDTRENAAFSVALLAEQGVTEVLLVSHGWHLPRAQRAFLDAVKHQGASLRIVPAPLGLAGPEDRGLLQWLPGLEGAARVRQALRELLGLWLGA